MYRLGLDKIFLQKELNTAYSWFHYFISVHCCGTNDVCAILITIWSRIIKKYKPIRSDIRNFVSKTYNWLLSDLIFMTLALLHNVIIQEHDRNVFASVAAVHALWCNSNFLLPQFCIMNRPWYYLLSSLSYIFNCYFPLPYHDNMLSLIRSNLGTENGLFLILSLIQV